MEALSEFVQTYPTLLILLVISSCIAGFVAGLFGIGGGAILVPMLFLLFSAMGFESTAMHSALATSLATIIFTSLRSVRAHNERGAVDWQVLKSWCPWIMLGAIVGQLLANILSGQSLTIIFAVLAYVLSVQLFFGHPDWKLRSELPHGPIRSAIGGLIGALSTLMGIGGGTFGVSLMTLCGRSMQQAVATAAGFGAAIGLPSAITAMFTSTTVEGLPPFSIGYVNILAFTLITAMTVSIAPFGAYAAHKLDAKHLKRLFAVLLFAVATHMWWKVF